MHRTCRESRESVRTQLIGVTYEFPQGHCCQGIGSSPREDIVRLPPSAFVFPCFGGLFWTFHNSLPIDLSRIGVERVHGQILRDIDIPRQFSRRFSELSRDIKHSSQHTRPRLCGETRRRLPSLANRPLTPHPEGKLTTLERIRLTKASEVAGSSDVVFFFIYFF